MDWEASIVTGVLNPAWVLGQILRRQCTAREGRSHVLRFLSRSASESVAMVGFLGRWIYELCGGPLRAGHA